MPTLITAIKITNNTKKTKEIPLLASDPGNMTRDLWWRPQGTTANIVPRSKRPSHLTTPPPSTSFSNVAHPPEVVMLLFLGNVIGDQCCGDFR